MELQRRSSGRFPMEKATKILRRSVHTFLLNYQYLTTTAAILALPYSASILFSQAFLPSPSSSLLPTIFNRFKTLFQAAGFPPSSEFFSILTLKISQTISSSIFVLPFTLISLLIAKASVIQALSRQKKSSSPPSFSSVLSLHKPLLLTHICSSFLLLSANATAFSILFFGFNFLEWFRFSSPNCTLFLSAAGAVVYSIILANALIICNLAMVVSGFERCGGFMAILKACVLIRGRSSTALSLAVPLNLLLAGVEALFHYRIVRMFHVSGKAGTSMALEGIFIAYLYSILVVLDTVVSCIFFKWCKERCLFMEEDEIAEEERNNSLKLKDGGEVPV